MRKLNIAILFGGYGEEHPISVKSAKEVAKNLDLSKYEPFWIGITKRGEWKLCDGPDTNWESDDCRPAIVSPDRNVHGLLVQEHGQYKAIRLDVVLPVLHGKFGEDGAVQGLLELSSIPYVGCDIQSSALCMDKSLAYTIVRSAGIATPNFWVTNGENVDGDQFSYPVFVKPARSGSSFGVTKVLCKEDLADAIQTARQYDTKVLIEEAIVASEVGCAVLGNGTDLIVGEPDRIHLSHGFFRIHQENKPETGSENANIIVPADIPVKARLLAQQTAKDIYRALGCKGISRVDMFLKEDGTIMLNEVNTLPGLTSYSRYPRMMAAVGIPMTEVIDRIVALALKGKNDAVRTT